MITPTEPASQSAEDPFGAWELEPGLGPVLAGIAATAADRDRDPAPSFPDDAIDALERAGVLGLERAGRYRSPACRS